MRSVPLPFLSKITLLWTRAREPGPVSPVKVDSPLPFPWTQRGEIYKYGPQFFKADIGANQLPFINLELFLDFLWKGDGHSRCGLKHLLFPPSNFYMTGVKIALLLSRAAFPPKVCTAARNPGFSANTSLWKKNGPIHASSKTWETACSAGVKEAE